MMTNNLSELVAWRHHFHQHPEVSNFEFETTAYIKQLLSSWGVRLVPTTLTTGVIAEVGDASKGPTIALRADIDALPITEATGATYTSVNTGVMHACGHDFHQTALLGSAFELKQNEAELQGLIRFIFQPAEETHTGADDVIAAGHIDDVQAIVGFHNKPDLQVGEVGILKGGLMAAVDQFKVTFTGIGTHAAMPQLGNDPIVALSTTISTLQTIVARNVDPQQTAVVSVTHIAGGSTWNVLPESAWFEGTIRTFTNETRALSKQRFYDIVNGQAQAFGLKVVIDWSKGPDVTENDPVLTEIVSDETSKFLKVVKPAPSNAGEDFATFSQKIPGVFVFFGSHGTADWHHPDFDVDDAALPLAVEWYTRIATRLLREI
ncbi:amidohydrolase [Periweissella cryptocerci]|uniref:Amidohydrolase n=2 Tax=Periweissella cryptocerci TaxID=2506420 RepID=A0A4P6YSU3_9LACO|nr:amidohydrolase [Periweissella cryptocerci]QBO35794.1 amidohydrolase [Periweissella cryptocerci]